MGWFLLLALTLTYNPWLGRFFVFPIALSAAVWGVIARWAPAAWATAVLAAVTIILALVHYVEKPSGIRLLDRTDVASVWTLERWEVQSQHDPPLGPLLRSLDEQVPARASVALALGDNDFGYPAFGPHLERHVVLVPPGSTAREIRADWFVTNSERAGEIDRSCWAAAFRSSEGSVFRRSASCG